MVVTESENSRRSARSTIVSILRSRSFGTAAGLLSIVVLVLLVDVESLWGAFSNATAEILGLSLGISVLLVYISALKWNLFIEAFSGRGTSVFRLFALYLVGYFVNLLLPSNFGGDAVRSWHAGKKVGQHEAFAATILERYTGLVAMTSLAVVFIWFVPPLEFEIKAVILLFALLLVLTTVWAVSPNFVSTMQKLPGAASFGPHLEKVQRTFRLVRERPALMCNALLLSFLFHSSTVLNTVVAGVAVGWENPPIGELFVMLPIILFIGSLPVSPSGLGIQEGAFFVFLQMVGATEAEALGVGLLLRAKGYVLGVAGGLVWLMLTREGRVRVPQPPAEAVEHNIAEQ